MNKNNNKMDLLGNAPVPQALMALGIPIMIGMLINALYNLVDAYFIGGLGESQMGAISIAFPLGQVVVGLGLMFGNGAASYLSRLLGRGDREAASKVASTALYSSVCIGAVIIIGTAIFLKPILTMLGATDTVFADESLQKVVEEGVIPNAYARYTWRGITLKNGEVAILTPSNNSMGLYCNSGRYITINYTLSRSAFHRSRVRAYVAGPSSEFVREITASGLRSGFTTQATDYYYGMVTNLSSDAFTIKSFSITF